MVPKVRRRALVLVAAAVTALATVTLGTGAATASGDLGGVSSAKPPTIRMLRLPALHPGDAALPIAVHGHIVVGSNAWFEDVMVGADAGQWTETYYRAVMWDLSDPQPAAVDLGALGKKQSDITGFDGRWAVGAAYDYGTDERAFAVDLTAKHPTMKALGSLGGRTRATAVDDGVVVGTSYVGDRSEAFAEDLNASSPHMVALGDLGAGSEATTIRDGLVAGTATSSADGQLHAFAVDLHSPHPTMRDLGPVGGADASRTLGPTAVERPVVVGTAASPTAATAGGRHAFAANVSGSTPGMRDISSGRPEDDSVPTDLRNGLAVGTEVQQRPNEPKQTFGFTYDTRTQRRTQLLLGTEARIFHVDGSGRALGASTDGGEHAFAFDGTDSDPTVTDLGRLAGARPTANGANDAVIIGSVDPERLTPYRGGDSRDAAVWPVGNTIRVTRPSVSVSEAAGTARIPVLRTGDLSKPASVRYQTVADTAAAGRDFATERGTLRFAAGQSRATLRVPVIDDSTAERSERFSVRLSAPSAGQRLLGSHTTVAIGTSDQRPDVEVSKTHRHGYVGDDVYNATGRRQTVARGMRRGETARFYVRLRNDGNSAIALLVRRRHVPSALHVMYHQGSSDLTYAFTHGGWEPLLPLGHTLTIRMDVSVDSAARVGASWTPTVVAQWRGDHLRTDAVGTKITVGR